MIRVVDIETTGMTPGDGAEVIELGWWDMHPTDRVPWPAVMGNFGSRFYSPERPCPPEVRAVHHIHPAEYEQAPRFDREIFAAELIGSGVSYVAAHNSEYEEQFLGKMESIPWLCTYKAALRVWPDAPHHGNQSLMYWRGLEADMEESLRHPPHRAAPDAYVTAHLLLDLLRHATLEQMIGWTREPRLLPTCPIGKFRGRPWSEVESGFLHWMMRQPDMEADLKWNANRELDRRRTERLRGD